MEKRTENKIKKAWLNFEGRGTGRYSDLELKLMLEQARDALPYLEARRHLYPLALVHAQRTVQDLEQYANARGLSV